MHMSKDSEIQKCEQILGDQDTQLLFLRKCLWGVFFNEVVGVGVCNGVGGVGVGVGWGWMGVEQIGEGYVQDI